MLTTALSKSRFQPHTDFLLGTEYLTFKSQYRICHCCFTVEHSPPRYLSLHFFLLSNPLVPCYGHFAQKCLWHFQGNLCTCATRWASPVQRWDGRVVCFRGKPLRGSTRKIWKRFHWHSARFCKYIKGGAPMVTELACSLSKLCFSLCWAKGLWTEACVLL